MKAEYLTLSNKCTAFTKYSYTKSDGIETTKKPVALFKIHMLYSSLDLNSSKVGYKLVPFHKTIINTEFQKGELVGLRASREIQGHKSQVSGYTLPPRISYKEVTSQTELWTLTSELQALASRLPANNGEHDSALDST